MEALVLSFVVASRASLSAFSFPGTPVNTAEHYTDRAQTRTQPSTERTKLTERTGPAAAHVATHAELLRRVQVGTRARSIISSTDYGDNITA